MSGMEVVNRKKLQAGMVCEWREWEYSTGRPRIAKRARVRLVERDGWGDWVVRHLSNGQEGAGWRDWELFPVD